MKARSTVKKMSQCVATGPRGGNSYLVDDLADANLFLMECSNGNEMINVGVRTDQTIKELAQLIEEVVGFKGELAFDLSQPGRTTRKLLDAIRFNQMGWRARISLREELEKTYSWSLSRPWAKKTNQRPLFFFQPARRTSSCGLPEGMTRSG